MDRKRKRTDLDSDSSEDESEARRKQLESDSSDSEDDNDGNWTENGEQKIKKKKKTKGKVSDSDSNDSDSADQFDDGFDSDLMGDEEDRAQLEEMTEAQREKILYERTERREAMKKRWEIEKKIRERAKLEKLKRQDSDSSDDERRNSVLIGDSSSRRQNLDKNKKIDTLERLKEERKRKENAKRQKDEDKKALDVKDVFSSDESDDDEGRLKTKYMDNSSDSDSDDERRRSSSDDEGPRRKRDQEDDPEALRRREKIAAKEDLFPAKVSRLRLAQWLHMTWFPSTITGCYVRVNIGSSSSKGLYRIAEVTGVVDSSKVYSIDGGDGSARSQTNKALKLKIGDMSRDFRFAFISNERWTDTEFDFWKGEMERTGNILPTHGQIAAKMKKLEQAKKHVITDMEIERMVKEKAKYRSAPVNFATKKTTLIKLRDAAETEGNIDQVARIQQELEKLEERANMLNRERQKDISGITYINDRIKAKLKERDAIGAKEWKEFNEKKVDPFTRRTTAPIMVSNTNQETKSMIKDVLAERYTEDIDMRYEELVFVKENKENKKTPKKSVEKDEEDLYGVHDFDLDIDIDI